MNPCPAAALLLAAIVLPIAMSACTRTVPGRASDSATTGSEAPSGSMLDSQLLGLERQITTTREYNTAVSTFLDGREPQLAAALAADRSLRPTVQEFELRSTLQGRLSRIDRDAQACQETIAAHEKVLVKATSDPRRGELQSGIASLAAEREEMLRLRTRLIMMNDKLNR